MCGMYAGRFVLRLLLWSACCLLPSLSLSQPSPDHSSCNTVLSLSPSTSKCRPHTRKHPPKTLPEVLLLNNRTKPTQKLTLPKIFKTNRISVPMALDMLKQILRQPPQAAQPRMLKVRVRPYGIPRLHRRHLIRQLELGRQLQQLLQPDVRRVPLVVLCRKGRGGRVRVDGLRGRVVEECGRCGEGVAGGVVRVGGLALDVVQTGGFKAGGVG